MLGRELTLVDCYRHVVGRRQRIGRRTYVILVDGTSSISS